MKLLFANPPGQVFPTLFWQVREIRCLFFDKVPLRDMIFHNFQLAGRSAIRKPPNLVDWVHSLRQLEKRAGDKDTQSIIRTWNGQCTSALQIVGRKAMALKNLWEHMPEKALDLLTEMVSVSGWDESGWTEDGLASKRILPGYIFRCTASKKWTARQTVTPESCILMLERIQQQLNEGSLKGKLTEKVLAERAQFAAVVHNLEKEMLEMATFSATDLQEWKDAYLTANPAFDMEVNSAMLRHDEQFTVKDIPLVKSMLDKLAGRSVGSNSVQVMSEKVRVQATMLEESTFQLLLQQMDYDVEAFKCYLTRVSNVEASVHHKKEEWLVQAHGISQEAAQHWWDANVTLLNCEALAAGGISVNFKDTVREVGNRHSVPADQVVPVVVGNWTAPCQIPTGVMNHQANLLAEAMNFKDSIGLILMPQFHYQMSELWLQEVLVMNHLGQRKLNVSGKWALMFQEQVDSRDKRSLAYDGRIVVPVEAEKSKGYLWQGAKVMRGRTEFAKQLAASRMVQVEDVRENALPTSSADRSDRVKGAAKASQVGEDGMQKVLDALLEGPDWGVQQGKVVLLLIELNPGVANLLDAFMTRKAGMRMPVHYLGVADSDLHLDWLVRTKMDILKQRHYSGELVAPGRPQPSKEVPADLLETPPAAPVLSKLAVKERDSENKLCPKLMIPKEVMDTWSTNENFKDQFLAKMKSIQEDLCSEVVLLDGTAGPHASSPAKHGPDGTNTDQALKKTPHH